MVCFPPLQRLHLKRSWVCSMGSRFSTRDQIERGRRKNPPRKPPPCTGTADEGCRPCSGVQCPPWRRRRRRRGSACATDVGRLVRINLNVSGCREGASEGETAHSSPRPCPSRRSGRRSLQMRVDQRSLLAISTKSTHNPSSDHHATRERAPAYRKRGSNLRSAPSSSQLSFP